MGRRKAEKGGGGKGGQRADTQAEKASRQESAHWSRVELNSRDSMGRRKVTSNKLIGGRQ
jgi:hypothetical protein